MSLSPLWDRRVAKLQVADAKETTILVRALVSAKNAGALGDLRNEVREKLLSFLRDEQPEALPRHRAEVALSASARAAMQAAAPDASAARTTKRLAGE